MRVCVWVCVCVREGGGGSRGVRARPARHCPASSLNAGVFEFPVEAKSWRISKKRFKFKNDLILRRRSTSILLFEKNSDFKKTRCNRVHFTTSSSLVILKHSWSELHLINVFEFKHFLVFEFMFLKVLNLIFFKIPPYRAISTTHIWSALQIDFLNCSETHSLTHSLSHPLSHPLLCGTHLSSWEQMGQMGSEILQRIRTQRWFCREI